MFKDFAIKHYNAAFALKCLAVVATIALTTAINPAAGVILAASVALVAKDMLSYFMKTRSEDKKLFQASRTPDQFEPSTPRMGNR